TLSISSVPTTSSAVMRKSPLFQSSRDTSSTSTKSLAKVLHYRRPVHAARCQRHYFAGGRPAAVFCLVPEQGSRRAHPRRRSKMALKRFAQCDPKYLDNCAERYAYSGGSLRILCSNPKIEFDLAEPPLRALERSLDRDRPSFIDAIRRTYIKSITRDEDYLNLLDGDAS
ncbi:hypothetical protein SPRG_18620, partial [Saprolegnia parasitica CBS 223.65]